MFIVYESDIKDRESYPLRSTNPVSQCRQCQRHGKHVETK